MKKKVALLACIPALSFLVVAPAINAFEYPLSPTAIRSAYLSGHATDGRNARLFGKYVRDFSAPESGPYGPGSGWRLLMSKWHRSQRLYRTFTRKRRSRNL